MTVGGKINVNGRICWVSFLWVRLGPLGILFMPEGIERRRTHIKGAVKIKQGTTFCDEGRLCDVKGWKGIPCRREMQMEVKFWRTGRCHT
jgi:hypothetical protein